jgi:hypothetical protein
MVALGTAVTLAMSFGVPAGADAGKPIAVRSGSDPAAVTVTPVDDVANAVGALGRTSYRDSFAGLQADEKNHRLTVFAQNQAQGQALVDQAAGRMAVVTHGTVQVHVQPSKYSMSTLYAARTRLWTATAPWRSVGVQIYSIALSNDGNGLKVSTNNPISATALAAKAAAPLADQVTAADVHFVAGQPIVDVDRCSDAPIRCNDIPPFTSGDAIGPGGSARANCTAGYPIHSNALNTDLLVTAAHCYGVDANVYTGPSPFTGQSTYIGKVIEEEDYWDASGIQTSTWSGAWVHDNYLNEYRSAAYSWASEAVCQSGFTSNQVCGIVVTDDDIEWTGANGIKHRGVEGAVTNTPGISVRGGDSGGPVHIDRSDGYLESRGLVSAGSVTVGSGFQYILWTETPDILRDWNATLISS